MNARVLLLVVVSALFMAAWSGDQRAMSQAFARQDALRAARLAVTAPDATPTRTVSSQTRHSAAAQPPAAQPPAAARPAVSPVAAPPAIPPHVAAGDYIAVNHAGRSVRVTVAASHSDPQRTWPARDLYFIDDASGDRWYLVRVHSAH